MRYYLGVDWADQTHAVWVVDESGAKITARAVSHTAEGLGEWGRELDEWRAQGIDLWAAIERPDGRVVDFLLDHGVVVYPVNPKALDRARDRFRQSGAKSDPVRRAGAGRLPAHGSCAPARLAAELGSGPGAEAPHRRLSAAHPPADPPGQPADRHAEGILPAGARGRRGDERPGPGVPARLSDAGGLTALTERQWQRWARAHRLPEARTGELWAVLRQPQLPVPAHVVRAKARLMHTLMEQLRPVVAAVAQYRKAIDDFFASMPAAQWARTLPIGKHGITAPTLWARLGDAPGRWASFRHLQAHAGTVPVTKRSGKQQRVVQFRFACDKALRHVVDQVAYLSLLSSAWARPYYDQQRARGHSHRQALRALGAKWLKIIFVMWQRQVPYDEQYHLATMTRQQLRQRQAKSLDMNQRKSRRRAARPASPSTRTQTRVASCPLPEAAARTAHGGPSGQDGSRASGAAPQRRREPRPRRQMTARCLMAERGRIGVSTAPPPAVAL